MSTFGLFSSFLFSLLSSLLYESTFAWAQASVFADSSSNCSACASSSFWDSFYWTWGDNFLGAGGASGSESFAFYEDWFSSTLLTASSSIFSWKTDVAKSSFKIELFYLIEAISFFIFDIVSPFDKTYEYVNMSYSDTYCSSGF